MELASSAGRGLELRVAPAQRGAGGGGGEVDVLAHGQVERGPERRGLRIGRARDPARELLDDRARERVGDHLHVAGAGAQGRERLDVVPGDLRVDHRLEGEHVVLHEVGDDRLRQVRVGAGEERPEVLRVADQVVDRLVLLGAVVGGRARRVVHHHADVLAPQRQERLLGVRPVDRADRPGHVHRVGVERGGGRLELGLPAGEGRAGGRGGQVHVLAQQRVEPDAQARGRRGGRGLVEARGPDVAHAHRGDREHGQTSDQSNHRAFHGCLLSGVERVHFTRISPRMDWCRRQKYS